jgi:hypothetical protein
MDVGVPALKKTQLPGKHLQRTQSFQTLPHLPTSIVQKRWEFPCNFHSVGYTAGTQQPSDINLISYAMVNFIAMSEKLA